MKDVYTRWAPALLVLLSALLLLDLFPTWREVRIEAAGATLVRSSVGGWDGWGAVVGIFALALLVYALLELSGYVPAEPGTEIAPAVMAIVILFAAIARFETVDDVSIGNALGAVTIDRRWPASVAVVLAVCLAAVAVARMVVRGPAFRGHAAPLGR